MGADRQAALHGDSEERGSFAHRGVLFFDEAPQFATGVLDALRQPLESGEVLIARTGLTARFPARFLLVLAANPCPCAPIEGNDVACQCPPMVRRRYQARLSGPLLDRIDVRVTLTPVPRRELWTIGASWSPALWSPSASPPPGPGRAAVRRHSLAHQRRGPRSRAATAPSVQPAVQRTVHSSVLVETHLPEGRPQIAWSRFP